MTMSDKVVEYEILVEHSPRYLKEEVARLISEGWQPLGGVATVSHSRAGFVQAMVKMGKGNAQD